MEIDDEVDRIKNGKAFGCVDPTFQQPFCARCGRPVLQYGACGEVQYWEKEFESEKYCTKCLKEILEGSNGTHKK